MPLRISNGLANICTSILATSTINENNLITDAELDYDGEDELEQELNRIFKEIRIEIDQAETTGDRIHESTLTRAINKLNIICDECGDIIETVRYRIEQTAYGEATINATGGVAHHGDDDIETNETSYQCRNCNGTIERHGENYFIPDECLTELKEIARIILTKSETIGQIDGRIIERMITDETDRPFPIEMIREQTTNRTNPKNNEFPEGRQLQSDISAHGPAGPMMIPRNNGVIASYPEEFLWRPGANWICRHCSTQNEGESQKCRNQECKKGKFTPIVNKTIK